MVSSKLVGNGSLNCLLLSLVMVSFSLKYDYSMFTRVQGDVIIVILVYVDDILVASNSLQAIIDFKEFLHDQFKLKDVGTLKYFLGLEVAITSKGISLC